MTLVRRVAGAGGAAVTLAAFAEAFNYTTHPGAIRSESAEDAHRLALLGGGTELAQRPRQVVGHRLDRRVLGLDDRERSRRPRLGGEPLAQRRPGSRAVLGGFAIQEAKQL